MHNPAGHNMSDDRDERVAVDWLVVACSLSEWVSDWWKRLTFLPVPNAW